MSTRTPGLQQRSLYHSYWGQYPWDATFAPPSWNGRTGDIGGNMLPNTPNYNPPTYLVDPEYSKLEAGDTASTITVTNEGDKVGLWVCIYPGTQGGGDAVWARCDNVNYAQQTVRAAPVIVVAQGGNGGADPYLFTLADLGSPPLPVNGLNLNDTGDIASITCDYLDPGDGSQLEQALLAAAGAGVGIDVRLRPCSISLTGTTTVPLTVPQSCRLQGAGRNISEIVSRIGTGHQDMFVLDASSELRDLKIHSPDPGGEPPAGSPYVVTTSASGTGVRVQDCTFLLVGAARTGVVALNDPTATIEVFGCEFSGQDQPGVPSIGVQLGPDPGVAPNSFATATFDVGDCTFIGMNCAVSVYNALGDGTIHDCLGLQLVRPRLGVIAVRVGGTLAKSPTSLTRLSNIRMNVTAVESQNDGAYIGFRLTNNADGKAVSLFHWDGLEVFFTPPSSPQVPRVGFYFSSVGSTTGNSLGLGTITGCTSLGHTVGVEIYASSIGQGPSLIDVLRFSACTALSGHSAGALSGMGFYLHTDGGSTVLNVGIVNCSASSCDTFNVNLADLGVTNAMVVSNDLSAPGGAALNNAGTNCLAALNIVV